MFFNLQKETNQTVDLQEFFFYYLVSNPGQQRSTVGVEESKSELAQQTAPESIQNEKVAGVRQCDIT